MMKRASSHLVPLTLNAAMIAAKVTQPVPCTSSLKQAISGVYLSRILLALFRPKSSKWMYALG